MPTEILNWGIEFILSLQAMGNWLIAPMNFFTFLGNEEFFLLVLPVLYWCVNDRLGLRLGILLMLSAGITSMFKLYFHDPRPYWHDTRVRLLTGGEGSFGLPSGHSSTAVAVWGFLATQIRRNWAWVVTLILILGIGFSRMFLGVHFPTDVFVGWPLGLAILLVFLALEGKLSAWLQPRSESVQIALIFVFALLFIFVGGLVRTRAAAFEIPDSWVQNASVMDAEEAIAPLSLGDIVVSGSALFGLASGAILLNNRGGFDAGGPWDKRLWRYLLGLVGVVLLWQGLDMLFALIAPDETVLGYVLRFIRYGFIGLWISLLGPMIFIRLGIAKSK